MKNNTRKNIINVSVGLIVVFVFIAAITNPKAKGFYWKATKGDDYVYLIGTTHAVQKNLDFKTKNLEKVLSDTQALALEVNFFTDKKIMEERDSKKESLKLEKGELKDFLSKEEQNKLDSLLSYFDIDYSSVSNQTPEGFNGLIGAMMSYKSGLTENGLDSYLAHTYEAEGKQIDSLESLEFQESFLKSDVEDFKDLVNSFNKTYMDDQIEFQKQFTDAFIDGDAKFMERTVEKYETKESIKINKNRNENMANKIDELVKGDKKYAIAVGTYHFFGKDSIIKELESKGYKVNRIS
ncbi:GumN family protein,TraB family (plasmid) [[Clostridium] sordellii]|uniref:TraB/GumN family protein n=1 Tax=Paraclostridium sordellii TaxID=1505 RepID=UPI000540E0DE|nr:TraB/GumN family protein [Paeniclostridium sordellii]CEK32663.1 GumN family protein,TraB family (plasmid) [[Clostridium] sordellii] [Paeniclostridium sordellii]